MTRGSPRRRALAVALLSVLPWSVVVVGPVVTLFFPAALLDYNPAVAPPLRFVPVWEFFAAGGRIPRNPELFPLSLVAYCISLAGALVRVVTDQVPDRAVAGFLVLAALLHLGVPLAFAHRLRYLAVPVGPLAALAVAWWYYAGALYSLVVRVPE